MFLINLMDSVIKHGTNDTPVVNHQPPKMYLLQFELYFFVLCDVNISKY